ncbi:ARM repeat-containing protein [Delitschia confertaspora ATCC 74209]|uniref:ARM repeat-containing protein n=1 Tax=Delitschia confertaspora ATCC 74209 TaxID=1513339 RepID=A0A9P4MS24_9PLEO|nr:ARM repeat-containing protein [Delitschia confertaspora ATCC 74209]
MSVLSPEIHAALTQLLQGLQSPDNVQRSAAEKELNDEWLANDRAGILLMGLSEQIQGQENQNTRSFAAVLFRKISSKTLKDPQTGNNRDLFMALQQPEREAIRAKLLEGLATESQPSVRKKVGDAVAELARQHTEETPATPWPALLGALFNASQSTDAGQRETAFRIFSTTPGIIEAQHQDVVIGAFKAGFGDSETSVRIAAVDAFASFFRSIKKKSQAKYYGLVPEILNILPPIKEAGDGEELSKAIVSLIDLAEVAPKMFKPLFNSLVVFSVSVIQDKDLGDMARQNALELMATFADYAPQMCKNDPNFANDMVTQCLSLMTDVGIDDDDAEEWNASEDLDVDESDMNHMAGEQCMDRLANKLGGQVILPPTFNWLPRMMTSSSWRDRHAALMAISAISEGCRELMVGELDKVLDLVLPALRDPHPRVRWAGCNAVGQMSTDFAGTMQEKYHQVVLPNIIPVLESAEPRVQAHAAAALVNFCEEVETSILEPYLDQLLSHLLMLLQSPKRFVQEQALSTIATVADSAEASFSKYYGTLMPLLFNVLREEQSKEYRLLRAKAMECATLIALAVGKERMGQDAFALMELLGKIQDNITDADDPQASYLLHCWGRMCRVLRQDFVPYLPKVIPPLAKLAAAKADIQLLEDDDANQMEGDDGWELVPLKGKIIGIKTSTLDDKHMATELIVIYAQVLKAAFEPYVNEIMDKIALPGLAFFFHDPVRVASAKCVPQLLNAFKEAHGPESTQLGQLWERTVEKVLEVLTTEPAIDTLAEMYQCFYECVEVIGKNSLTNTHMQNFIESARSVLNDYKERVKERLEEQAEADDGEEADEALLYAIEDDQNLLSDMNKAFHTIFKNQGTSFLPYWEQLLEYYKEAVVNPDPTQRQWAICIYDDVLEFCGPQSWAYSEQIIQPLIDGMRDDVPANRQAAVYGVGVAAHRGGEVWSDFAAASLPLLFQVTQRSNARADDDVFATENACASIAKILHYNAQKVQNWQDVVHAWIETLPVVNDEEAAPYAYLFLVQLIESQNPAVLAQPGRCFKYIAEALEAETLQGQAAARTVNAAKQLVTLAGLNLGQLAASLTPEQQRIIQAYFGQ